MKLIITRDYEEMSRRAADIVISHMVQKPDMVLGLATGSTPEGLYQKLIEAYRGGTIDFSNVRTFNLDEYYGIDEDNDQSYHYFMKEKLLDHVNIPMENTHILDGMAEDVHAECMDYERRIDEAGGIDLQILGIGKNGHIGFNEPGDVFIRRTHLVDLDQETIQANSRFFTCKEEVPTQALTMGIETIMKARKIILIASGEGKAEAIYRAVKCEIHPMVPASILHVHPDVTVIVDEEAASKL